MINEDHQGATPEKNIAGNTVTPEEARVDSGETEQEPGWVLSSGDLQKEQKRVPQIEKDPRSQWDFRIGKNGVKVLNQSGTPLILGAASERTFSVWEDMRCQIEWMEVRAFKGSSH